MVPGRTVPWDAGRLLALCLLPVLAFGCAGDAVSVGTSQQDSAGIEIVTNPPQAVTTAPSWTLSAAPVAEVGMRADLTLFRVVAVTPLEGGEIVIGMTLPPQVVVAAEDGTPLGTLGRQGEGPGEFEGVGSVVDMGGDSIAVWDPERRRVSVFDRGGALLGEIDLREVAPLSWIASPDVSSASARTHLLPSSPGSFWLFSVGVLGPGSGVFRPSAPSYRIAIDGEVLAELPAFPGDEVFNGDQFGSIPHPFGAMTHGSALGELLTVGTGSASELSVYGPRGRLIRLIRWTDPERNVGGERQGVWDTFWAEHLASLPPADAAFRAEAMEAIPTRPELPALGAVVVADSGEIWVGPYLPGHQALVKAFVGNVPIPEQRWLVFRPDGGLMASVRTPAGFMIHAVRGGRVWGVHRDDLDVESVRAYRVEMP